MSDIVDALAIYTCSVYRLDPTLTTPLEPLADVVPGITPLRVTYDMVDGESFTADYETTEHAVQAAGVVDFTSNVRRRLKSLSINGTFGALMPLVVGLLPPASPRLDKMRFQTLLSMADAGQPVAVATPRVYLKRAVITAIQENWGPADGDSMSVSITLREVRLVSPLTGDFLAPDLDAQAPGNNAATGGGQSSTTSTGQTATDSGTPGTSPSLGPAATLSP